MPKLTKESELVKDTDHRKAVELQHKHFAFIASVIATMPDFAPTLRAHKSSCANFFADACAQTNTRFNRDRFMAACGHQQERKYHD